MDEPRKVELEAEALRYWRTRLEETRGQGGAGIVMTEQLISAIDDALAPEQALDPDVTKADWLRKAFDEFEAMAARRGEPTSQFYMADDAVLATLAFALAVYDV